MMPRIRQKLPQATDRMPLGKSGLLVSPICLGLTASPETVIAAFEEGVNFFFITADLHWPLYDPLRRGLAKLLDGNPSRRDQIVIGVVSYLDDPLFSALQFHEVTREVPGLERVDLIIAGAVSNDQSFSSRFHSMVRARAAGQHQSRAIGASFHQRSLAAVANYYDLLDISYIRYNSAHPGARVDLFPYVQSQRSGLIFNFKSTMSRVTREMLDAVPASLHGWIPDVCDYYRFVLSRPEIDGILCSPLYPHEVKQLARTLELSPLSEEEQDYMIRISSIVHASPAMTSALT